MPEALSEVAVTDADPKTRHIYDRIMSLTGVGSPALIYRHFAVFPGFLPWVWEFVGPELESGMLIGHALKNVQDLEPVKIPAVSLQDLKKCGIDAEAHMLIDTILATYNRMNPINLSLITAIRNRIDESEQLSGPAPELENIEAPAASSTGTLPSPLEVASLPEDLRATIKKLSSAIPSPGVDVTPTLYRHLAIWPEFVELIAPGILDAIGRGDVEDRMAKLTKASQPLIQHVMHSANQRNLAKAPLDDPRAMIRTLDTFTYVIPQLIIIGAALRDAIPMAKN